MHAPGRVLRGQQVRGSVLTAEQTGLRVSAPCSFRASPAPRKGVTSPLTTSALAGEVLPHETKSFILYGYHHNSVVSDCRWSCVWRVNEHFCGEVSLCHTSVQPLFFSLVHNDTRMSHWLSFPHRTVQDLLPSSPTAAGIVRVGSNKLGRLLGVGCSPAAAV